VLLFIMNEKTLVIFFSDIVGSTTMYEQLGDQAAQQMVSKSLKGMISEVQNNGGTLIQTVGDEVMAHFPNADFAFNAAVSIQLRQQRMPSKVRIGFHYGDVIENNGDYFGNAVNVAARMAARAIANEIMTTKQTVELLSARNHKNVRFLSTSTVKGKNELLSIYEVLWEPEPEEDLTRMVRPKLKPISIQEAELELVYQKSVFRVNSTDSYLSIGRSDENNITINESHVSRKHAKIELKNSRFILTDTSSNGTFVISGNNKSTKIVRESFELVGSGSIELGENTEKKLHNIMYKRIN